MSLDPDGTVSKWASLVNPGQPIPAFIQGLTGITDEMVATAPPFSALAHEVRERLQGRLFVAHNARFDLGFLQAEFQRLGLSLETAHLCTVKLSRKLYPQHAKHNLDALVARHGLTVPARHRALADADVLRQFWQVLCRELGPETLMQAVDELTGKARWPTHLDPGLLARLPSGPGVFYFKDAAGAVVHVGKALKLRQGVLAALQSRTGKRALAQEVFDLDWVETAGDLGSALIHAQGLRRLRQAAQDETCSWRLTSSASGHLVPQLTLMRDVPGFRFEHGHGLFGTRKDALQFLRELAGSAMLCRRTMGLEDGLEGQGCRAWSKGECSGVCVGREARGDHDARLLRLLSSWQLRAWPWAGPVAWREGATWHVLDNWCYLGTVRDLASASQLAASQGRVFDRGTYRILVGNLHDANVTPL